jgi:mannose-6-phosphate isomerase-like protein (cupin superfamily)
MSHDPRKVERTVRPDRPWGCVYMVVRNQECSADLTEVRPGQRASLHSHEGRYELFHFLDEGGHLEVDSQVHHPRAHDEFLIEPGTRHRSWAEAAPFRMLVVSFGRWEAEDQVRHEDDYGRESKPMTLGPAR